MRHIRRWILNDTMIILSNDFFAGVDIVTNMVGISVWTRGGGSASIKITAHDHTQYVLEAQGFRADRCQARLSAENSLD